MAVPIAKEDLSSFCGLKRRMLLGAGGGYQGAMMFP